jgi:hypothetical protein
MKSQAPDSKEGEASVRHFERVLALTKNLAVRGVAVRGHEYYPHFFGMWKIIAGSFEHRYQFLRDARDQILCISEASFDEFGNELADWKKVAEREINARQGADPFRHVEQYFE